MTSKVIKATTGLGLNRETYEDGKPHPHPQVEDLVSTIGFSLVKELIQYLKGPEGEAAIEHILDRQSRVVSNLATTEEARQASRVAAQEIMSGTYDASQRKWSELYSGLPKSTPYVAIVAVGYVSLLALGLLLTSWRFAFYGLH